MQPENEHNESLSAGEAKAREYANRFIDGEEDYNSIIEGLGPVMIASINAAIERRGFDIPTEQRVLEPDSIEHETETMVTKQVAEYIAKMTEGRPKQVQELYTNLVDKIVEDEQRMLLIKALFIDTYNTLRIADYGINPNEELVWEEVQQHQSVQVKESNGWMYRGIFPEGDEETVTRGSCNVRVTTELVDALDAYIASGKIKVNYKFGQPNTTASPQERHDSISMYFLEQPSDDVLQELSDIVKPYVRGDDLLGRKVAEGFYLSEVGSVQDEHIEEFVETLKGIDLSFAEAVKRYASDRKGRSAMSEAQFYAVKKVAEVFGYNLIYGTETGFSISK